MKLGIVGNGADKFDSKQEALVKFAIIGIIYKYNPVAICSGRSPVGGVDIWAEEIATQHNVPFQPFPAEVERWDGSLVGKIGYKQRNLQIAGFSDKVICIVSSVYPPNYTGMRFKFCYHCVKSDKQFASSHIKSGGCWTARRCKDQEWMVV